MKTRTLNFGAVVGCHPEGAKRPKDLSLAAMREGLWNTRPTTSSGRSADSKRSFAIALSSRTRSHVFCERREGSAFAFLQTKAKIRVKK